MRTYDDSFSGQRIYPGKLCRIWRGNADGNQMGHEWTRARTTTTIDGTDVGIAEADWGHWAGISRMVEQGADENSEYRVRGDSKIFRFQNGKSESLFLQRKNPRRISWTVLYRRQHRKGISEEVAKKRTRRTVKAQRAIVGASLDVIKEKRSMRPEARSAARAAAIKESKDKKAEANAAKKAEKAKNAAAGKGQTGRIVGKQGAKGSAPKVKATTR
ncbi:60s ribosomal protein l24 [Colletotrichum asianum]